MTNSYGEIDTNKEYYCKFQDELNTMIQAVSSVQLCYSISWNFLVQIIIYLKGMAQISQFAYQYCDNEKGKLKIYENFQVYCDYISVFNIILKKYEDEVGECERNYENEYLDFISHQKSLNRICNNVYNSMRKNKIKKNIAKSYFEAFNDHMEGFLLMCDITTTYDIYPLLMEELERIVL